MRLGALIPNLDDNKRKNYSGMIRVFECFSGYGSQSLALEKAGIPHTVVGIAEILKAAVQMYAALRPGRPMPPNYGDVTRIDWSQVPDFDLFTYSFPCQDVSTAGSGGGLERGTRSGLLWECERAVTEKRPRWLLLENVVGITYTKHRDGFERWLRILEQLGYTNYRAVLNAHDFGVPQRRRRVFVVSIRGEHRPFEWPAPCGCTVTLEDIISPQYTTNEHYYRITPDTIFARAYAATSEMYGGEENVPQMFCAYGGKQIHTVAPCLVANAARGPMYYGVITVRDGPYKIRRLNGYELARLMGLTHEQALLFLRSGVSMSSQAYLAGNSIVVPVLEAIFKQLVQC